MLLSFPAPAAADSEQLVSDAAAGWTAGAVNQEAAAPGRFFAGDLEYAHASALTQNKEAYIAAVVKGPARYESFTFSEVKVKLHGKTVAVLSGHCDVKMTGLEVFRVRTLQVYLENNGQGRKHGAAASTPFRRRDASGASRLLPSLCRSRP